jgi:hypothetical protein
LHPKLIMQRYPKQRLINSNHDYKVVINILKVNIQHNMKLNTTFEHIDQAITHFRGCYGDLNRTSTLQGYKPDNTTHMSHKGTMSGHNSLCDQRVGLGPTPP